MAGHQTFQPFNYGQAVNKGTRNALGEIAVMQTVQGNKQKSRLQELAERGATGDQGAMRERATIDPNGTANIMQTLNKLDDSQKEVAAKNAGIVAKMFAAAKDEQQFEQAKQILTANNINMPPEVKFSDRNLHIAKAQELADVIKQNTPQKQEWSTVEAGAPGGRLARIAFNKNDPKQTQQIGQPYADTSGGNGSGSSKKYQEMLGIGFPEQIARGISYGSFKTVTDPASGSSMIIDVENNREIGRMVPVDPSKPFGKMEWLSANQQPTISWEDALKDATQEAKGKASWLNADSTDFGNDGRQAWIRNRAKEMMQGSTGKAQGQPQGGADPLGIR